MKKLLIIIMLLVACTKLNAQEIKCSLKATTVKNTQGVRNDMTLNITGFSWETIDKQTYIFIHTAEIEKPLRFLNAGTIPLNIDTQNVQDIWDSHIFRYVIPQLATYGFQHSIRTELEEETLKYIQIIQNNGLTLNDPYLENYLYSLVAKIVPTHFLDGRPNNINIVIQQSPTINACCYPNGTIVITSGLLANLHSEDELVAILSHEIAHFVLDHSVQSINAEVERMERAAFWANFATLTTALIEGVMAYNSDYYIPGAATMSVAALSSIITTNVNQQLGMQYNHNQEFMADAVAKEVLTKLGYDPNALATALYRIEQEYIRERNSAMYFSSHSHPALQKRIQKAGTPYNAVNKKYEQIASFAVTNAAKMKFESKRFNQCYQLVSQNIENGIATIDDYLLKANCLLYLSNTEASNLEALDMINIAKQMDIDNINIYKAEIIAYLRLSDYATTQSLLKEYINRLHQLNNSLAEVHSGEMWNLLKLHIDKEFIWAKNMLIKLPGMLS